jgi:hypothetical protein
MAARTLNARQRLFVRELVWSDPPVSQAEAARRAGFKDKESAHAGYQLLRRAQVRAEYEKQLAEREELVKLRALRVAEETERLATVDIGDAFDAKGGLLPIGSGFLGPDGKPLRMPEQVRRAIASIEVETRYEGRGEEAEAYTVTKVKLHDKRAAQELFLKFSGKLKDKVEHDVAPGGTVQISINGIVKES